MAQHSLDVLYGAPAPQLLHNGHPHPDDTTFNYWWLAHVIDIRLDAYERDGDPRWLDAARDIATNIRERNGGSLFNDYFDDMLWYGLALERLWHHSAEPRDLDDALALWEECEIHGWNEIHGGSISWRRQQPGYKNTPANGPFVILGARLARTTGERRYLSTAHTALTWLENHLVGPDGFVEDGLGREGGAAIDTQWRFTYNQGLYIGACVELFRATGDPAWLDKASRTARTSISHLGPSGIFRNEGAMVDDVRPDHAGGDVGLFKGIWYRYAAHLLAERHMPEIAGFVRSSTDALWRNSARELRGVRPADGAPAPLPAPLIAAGLIVRPGDDWGETAPAQVGFSTLLSAVMALEVRALLDP